MCRITPELCKIVFFVCYLIFCFPIHLATIKTGSFPFFYPHVEIFIVAELIFRIYCDIIVIYFFNLVENERTNF
jgi:hypothetical protein